MAEDAEAFGCAWLRLSIANKRFDEAPTLAVELRAAAAARGLRRMLMRALALSVVLEEDAGHRPNANADLAEFLALFAETDYARSVVLERRSCAPVMERFLDGAGDSPLGTPARSLLSAIRGADADRILSLSTRVREILWRLDRQGD